MKKIVASFLFCLVLITGCTAQAPEVKEEQATWEPLIGTYVGDAMNVGKIANTVFLHGDTIDHLDLRGEMLHVIYKDDDEALSKWFSSSISKDKAIVYNTMMGVILVPNAKGFGFEVDGDLYEISRDILIDEMENLFSTLPKGNELFDEGKVKAFLQKHEETIQQYAVDSNYQKTFLAKFSISKSS
ncbi:hypothetical protein ACQKNX_04420 [Lysinibacillus sp. NPDC093712]|uniref:hypothetical protein n=1 Tax=Lysinibacillus sp. NPDC093712 TaxID=3390579 RepID=UPI003D01BCD5